MDGPQPALTAGALVAELDRGLADARHRRAIVTDDATGRGLAEGMAAAGYAAVALAVMLLDRDPPAPQPGVAREVGEAEMRAIEARLVAANDSIPDIDREVVIAGHAHLRGAVPGTRMFTAGDRDDAMLTLYARDGIAQPEDIEVDRAARGRGLASAMIALACAEARAAGAEDVFVLCHAHDGPFPLYAELGFRAAGRFWSFTRSA